jgi:RNA polymerase sigma factor (sigma-70 family)
MSGTTVMLQSFDKFVQHNYPKLLTHAMVVTKNYEDASDLLHNVYIKIKQRIIESGYTTQRYITYFCTAISNTFFAERKAKKNRIGYVDIDECYLDLEKILEHNDESWQQQEEFHQEKEYLTKMIFKFLENKYNDKEIYIFKCYYLFYPERMTYQKLSDQTGVSITYCSKIIKEIKMDIHQNLFKFIKNYDDNRRETKISKAG